MLSTTATKLRASPILVMAARTRDALRAGHNVIDMSLGEPDFPTPEHIGDAAVRAIKDGETRYTPTNGSTRLREAIVHKFQRDYAIACTPADINVGCGAKQVIYQAFLATLNPGDEVLLPAPYWASYADIVAMSSGVVKPLTTSADTGYALAPQALEAAITARTKWLVLNSPSNPSGTAYTDEQLLAFAEVVRRSRHNFLILTDDIYEHIIYDDVPFATLAALAPDLRHRILTVNGVSKAYSMTGWRVGWARGPRALIEAMTKIQMQVNSHTSSVSQAAAAAALEGPQDEVQRRCQVFQDRRDLLLGRFGAIPNLVTTRPGGAFYLFPDVRAFMGRRAPDGRLIDDDIAFVSYLLEEGLAVVPGSGFGMPGCIRISYATSEDKLHLAADRLIAALERLS